MTRSRTALCPMQQRCGPCLPARTPPPPPRCSHPPVCCHAVAAGHRAQRHDVAVRALVALHACKWDTGTGRPRSGASLARPRSSCSPRQPSPQPPLCRSPGVDRTVPRPSTGSLTDGADGEEDGKRLPDLVVQPPLLDGVDEHLVHLAQHLQPVALCSAPTQVGRGR